MPAFTTGNERPEKDWKIIMFCNKTESCDECNQWNKRLLAKQERDRKKQEDDAEKND